MAAHRDPITVSCFVLLIVYVFMGREEVFKPLFH